MTEEAGPDPWWGDSEGPHDEESRVAPALRRWPRAFAIGICAAVVVGLLGRVWWNSERPPPAPSQPRPQQPAVSTPRSPPDTAPLPATPREFVADAKQLADDLITSFPDSPQAYLLGGRIHYAFGDVGKAKDCWEKCLEVNSEFAPAWCSRGEAAWEHGQFAEAAGYLENAIRYNPQLDQKQVFLLADSLMNVGRAEEAVAVLQKAAGVGPLPPFGLFLLGNGYLELKEYKAAKEQFTAALALDPHSANVHYGLARAFAQLGQPEKAGEHRAEYATLKSQELAQTERSRPELRKRDWADVRPVARECYLNAGKIYAVHGDLDAAEKLWLKAVALEPRNPVPRKLLEVLYQQQGRQRDAILIARGIPSEGD